MGKGKRKRAALAAVSAENLEILKTAELVIRFQGKSWAPSIKADHALMFDIVRLGADNHVRAFAAALAVTWGALGRPKTSLSGCGYNVARFGGEVLNELHARGATLEEIVEAGGVAFAAVTRSFISGSEVAGAEAFSGAGPDAGTSA